MKFFRNMDGAFAQLACTNVPSKDVQVVSRADCPAYRRFYETTPASLR